MEFPKMLYAPNGTTEIDKQFYDCLIVESSEAQEDALSKGWFLSTKEAADALAKEQERLTALGVIKPWSSGK